MQTMKVIISKGYAKKVPPDHLSEDTGNIPHYGVYNRKKPKKIRVVFDCSARFGGTSLKLNDLLI